MDSSSPSSIARTAVRGSAVSIAASGITLSLGLLRTYLMVLFLLPDQIGLAALALFYVEISQRLGAFGLRSAYIHYKDPDQEGRGTYILFNLLTGAAGLLLIVGLAPVIAHFYPGYDNLQGVIRLYALIALFNVINQGKETFLEKDLAFRKIALMDVLASVTMTTVGPLMAYSGFGVWAILGEFGSGILLRFVYLFALQRGPRVRLHWDPQVAKKLWDYGKNVWAIANLTFLTDFFDDFWIGTRLGKTPLGLYSKAYEFARYPRRVVANPILSVFFPTFAQLQDDRKHLSQAFFRATSLIIRVGALFSLVIILCAPEVFRLFLPEAWQPMRLTFQLMIVYTFLDPVSLAAMRLLLATGKPQVVTRIRLIQAVVFIPAVIFAAQFGIEGVAIAANLMVLIGTILLFRATRKVADYSFRMLWFWPLFAMIVLVSIFVSFAHQLTNFPDGLSLIIKILSIPLSYALILLLSERHQLMSGLKTILNLLKHTT